MQTLSNLLLSCLPVSVVAPPFSRNLGVILNSSLPSPAPPRPVDTCCHPACLVDFLMCLFLKHTLILPFFPAELFPSRITSHLGLPPAPGPSRGSLPLLYSEFSRA